MSMLTSSRPCKLCTPFTSARPGARSAQVVRCTAERKTETFHKVAGAGDFLRNCAFTLAAAAAVALPMTFAPDQLMPAAQAGLTARDPIKNARALLRYALPIDNKATRQIQMELESISESLRIPGSKSLGPIDKAVRKAENILGRERQKIIADFAPDKKDLGLKALDNLDATLKEFDQVIASQDKQSVPLVQQRALGYVGQIEEAMVKGFPFEVPKEYSNLPQLKGRATLEMSVKLKEARENNVSGGVMKIVVDGYNAPVTAGNFVDLVLKKFYDGMTIQRADGFVVQTGKPANGDFYIENGKPRTIPFEIMVEGDKVPVYEETLEDNGRFREQPVLPFNAYGTLAMARGEFDTNSGSSQIFFLLKESELTPTGANLLDGRYAVFGYVVENQDLLQEMQVGDKIEYIKVTDGAQNLVLPPKSSSPAQLEPADE